MPAVCVALLFILSEFSEMNANITGNTIKCNKRNERRLLKRTGKSYVTYKGVVIPAKATPISEVSYL